VFQSRARFLVVSDLHAFIGEESDDAPSSLNFGTTSAAGPERLEACGDIVREKFGTVDAVLVAGDLTNKADPDSLRQVWEGLNALATSLQAKLIATAGNHDYDSRGAPGTTPRGNLLDLEPAFPFGSEQDKLQYFTYDYAVHSSDKFLILSVNSAAQHGYVKDIDVEYEHGRVTPRTTARIAARLSASCEEPDLRLLLVHHHIRDLPQLDLEERSLLQGGQVLLDVLAEDGDWLVVHGHKHRGHLQTAGGATNAPLIFSAGSFAATPTGNRFAHAAPNQFYVLDFADSVSTVNAGVGPASGLLYAWTESGFGWQPASASHEVPGVGGFGWRGSLVPLSRKLRELVERSPSRSLVWEAVVEAEPVFEFLSPRDLRQVVAKTDNASSRIDVTRDSQGAPLQFELTEERTTA
jgi:predicted phosphodiesterase